MSDYIDSLLDGVKILIDKELENLAFDKTVICSIVDNSNSKNGQYRVSNDNVTYIVYSEDPGYKIGESVRVLIPNNDYTRRKFILGRYGDEEANVPITYVSSTDSVVNVSGNLFNNFDEDNNLKSYGILMNGPEEIKSIWNQSLDIDNIAELQSAGIYNTLILTADFKTNMALWSPAEGIYGLQLNLFVEPTDVNDIVLRIPIKFTNQEMFGDPYSFNLPSTQSKIIPLDNINGIVRAIELSLFQNNDFKKEDGTKIYYPIIDGKIIYPKDKHIIVSNIEIAFGTNITNMEDNTLKIYSPDDLEYNYYLPSPETNEKNIGLLWYNKNEANKYLGFSDGIYDPSYDEINYLNLSKANNRLLTQRGKEGIPQDRYGLHLAADLEDYATYIRQASAAVTQDIYVAVGYLVTDLLPLGEKYIIELNAENKKIVRERTSDDIGGGIHQSIDSYMNTATTVTIPTIKDTFESYNKYLLNRLQLIANRENYDSEKNYDWDLEKGFPNIKIDLEEAFTEFISNLQDELDIVKEDVDTFFASYSIIVQNNLARIDKAINKLKNIVEKFPNFNTLEAFGAENDSETISTEDYFGYVFVVEKGEIQVPEWMAPYGEMKLDAYTNRYCVYWYKFNKGFIETEDSFLGKDWERIKKDALDKDVLNIGIPKNSTNGFTNDIMCEEGTGYLVQEMDAESIEQKYIAVLFYNHEMFKSNELIFTNRDEVPNFSLLDKTDGLTIEHLQNSFEDYPLYNDINYLQDGANGSKLRQLRCHFNGIKARDEDVLPEATVYWYIPDASMITFNATELQKRGFLTDYEVDPATKPSYSRSGYTCFCRVIEYNKDEEIEEDRYQNLETKYDTRDFWYKIRDYYEQSAGQNYIICKIALKDTAETYETKIHFTFGMMGNSGTDYTLSIVSTSNVSAVMSNQDLELNVTLRDNNNEKVNIEELQCDYLFSVATDLTKPSGASSAAILSSSVIDNYKIICSCRSGVNESEECCGILKIEVPNQNIVNMENRQVALSQLYAVPWSAGNYYLSGVTKIVYNNYGTLNKGSMFNLPYKLFNLYDDTQVDNVLWRIQCYNTNKNFELVNDTLVPKLVQKYQLRKVESTDQSSSTNSIKKEPISNDWFLEPPSLYSSNFDSNWFCIVEGYIKETKTDQTTVEKILWKQPLIIIQNHYESTFLNDWDGGFNIDNEGNMIMAAMLGAGKKNNDNTFSGVLMGDLTLKINNSTSTTTMGLYGFSNGVQSFGFRSDGTAFIGKANGGRIEFDGNKGIITSGKYVESGGTEGMQINLEDGHIDAYDFKLTSNKILMNSEESPYFKLRTFIEEKGKIEEKTLMYIGDDNYYLQNADYKENILESTWDDLTGENPFETKFNKGIKIDLVNGTIYASPGKIEDSYITGLTIDTRGSNTSNVVLAAGENFALKGNGDLNLKGNWEIWTGDMAAGTVCLSPMGVHHHFIVPDNVNDLELKDWKDLLTNGGFGAAISGDLKQTSWETISQLSIELTMIKVVLGLLAGAIVGTTVLNFSTQIMNFFGDLLDSLGSGITLAGMQLEIDMMKSDIRTLQSYH